MMGACVLTAGCPGNRTCPAPDASDLDNRKDTQYTTHIQYKPYTSKLSEILKQIRIVIFRRAKHFNVAHSPIGWECLCCIYAS